MCVERGGPVFRRLRTWACRSAARLALFLFSWGAAVRCTYVRTPAIARIERPHSWLLSPRPTGQPAGPWAHSQVGGIVLLARAHSSSASTALHCTATLALQVIMRPRCRESAVPAASNPHHHQR